MDADAPTLTPKNWSMFQHYRDRRPSWIKLHKTLLDDPVFNRLPIASQALAPKLWLLASEFDDGAITLTHDGIAYRLRISTSEFDKALSPLIDNDYFNLSGGVESRHATSGMAKPDTSVGSGSAVTHDTDSASGSSAPPAQKSKPLLSDVEDFCTSVGLPRSDGAAMFLHWEERGWGKVKNWKLTIQKWKAFGYLPSQKQQGGKFKPPTAADERAVSLARLAKAKEELHGRTSTS